MITLTNGVQIPENAVQLQTTAAIDGYYVTQPLRLVQYDETLPVAAVQLTYQNQPYTPPTEAELNVRMSKPDGTTVYNPCLGMDSSGIVHFAFTQQMTIVAGTGTLTVEITDSGVKNSAPIIAEIRPNPVPEGSIESADEFLTLQEILAEAEKWGQIVQTNASNIQHVVDNLADIQNAAENAQAAAASAAAAQKAAQEALGFRKFYSAVVPDANGNLDPSRPMVVDPAASVEIESAGDRIQSVTALGFTQQAGSGDPSPTNVRALTNGGIVLNKTVFNGSENWVLGGTGSGHKPYFYLENAYSGNILTSTVYSTRYPQAYITATNSAQGIGGYKTTCYIRDSKYATVVDFKVALQANPLPVWYATTDGTGSLYAPIQIQGGEYRATCLPLTAPLCDGDSVVSWARSGCDKVVTFDGSEDEDWKSFLSVAGIFYIDLPDAKGISGTLPIITDRLCHTPRGDLYNEVTYDDFSVQFPHGVIRVIIRADDSSTDPRVCRTYIADHPLTVWYRSTNYTEAADIAVSLETHQRAYKEYAVADMNNTEGAPGWKDSTLIGILGAGVNTAVSGAKSSVTPFVYVNTRSGSALYLRSAELGGLTQSQIKEKYPDMIVQVTLPYKTPITYAHEAVVPEAATGDQLTYTVTGQSGGTVSVSLKPFQDGGRAKTADSAANAQNAVNAQTANNSQQLGGLTLSALQNRLVPVGYIFSWAPASGGPDLSTAQKVAAYFGFGTWQAYGNGQVLVGLDAGQTEFATVGKTGGEKTHKMTTSEMPSHRHDVKWSSEGGAGTGNGVLVRDAMSGGPWPYAYWTGSDGGGQPHNNLQPYITVYRWQRVK